MSPTIGNSSGLQSNVDAHGRTASDTADASLSPLAFEANARQTYSVPLARPPIRVELPDAEARSTSAGHVAPLSLEHW